jgi:hypothetical protein
MSDSWGAVCSDPGSSRWPAPRALGALECRAAVTEVVEVELAGGRSGDAVRVADPSQLPAALAALGLHPPRPVVVVVGGAGRLEATDMERLRPVFVEGLVPVLGPLGAVVDGGTRSGVMRLVGEARSAVGMPFPLVGVVAEGTVELAGRRGDHQHSADLEPNHSHFILVPGDEWGAETPWITATASSLAAGAGSVTLLVNGGEVAYTDAQASVDVGRTVVAVAGSGRAADELAAAVAGHQADSRATAVVASGLVRAASAAQPSTLAELLAAVLRHPGPAPEPGSP